MQFAHGCKAACIAILLFGAELAFSQPYPVKPVHVITAEPGGGSDFAARLIGQGLAAALGQQVIVENRGIVAGEVVARAPADGYTLLLYTTPLWLAPLLRNNVRWDPVRDFAAITLAVSSPNVLVVHPSLPVKSVKELIALAQARPGELNYGAGSIGSTSHLAAELFVAMARARIVRISYKGTGPAVNDLIGGQVQLMFAVVTAGMQHVKSGRMRALAVTSAQPTALAPGVPTLSASGLPGYEAVTIQGFFAPARTPAALISRLNGETTQILRTPSVTEKFFNSGAEIVASSSEQLAATVKSEMAKWGKVIKDAGIQAEF